MKKIILIILFTFLITYRASAAQEDLYSWSWWSTKSGLTTGTVNDIIYTYLGSLGYAGTINDKLHSWLVDQTGLPATYTLNDLEYYYFVILGTVPTNGIQDDSGHFIQDDANHYLTVG